ncbi:helix-turn-helix domain-containing protein [Yersinia enterocolitica]|uniref:helix-turn-helix domain-containing protein n=1 Tax=Yersinia enterocolitica TaxID=630 RepID=UPI0005E68D20|nr:helix-turn-helix transcriptional regulator [Yersinia enterocolitica]CQJ10405.1 putative transcriptional regulatory protein [Yersinia enterocolitica]
MKKNGDNGGFVLSDLGMRLRHARVAQDITLKQLALKVGCSESLLSKLENEVASPRWLCCTGSPALWKPIFRI